MGSCCLQTYFEVVEIDKNFSGLHLTIVGYVGGSSLRRKLKVQVRKQ